MSHDKFRCPYCDKRMVPAKMWQRSSLQTYCGEPFTSTCVKEQITYKKKIHCTDCKCYKWVDGWPTTADEDPACQC